MTNESQPSTSSSRVGCPNCGRESIMVIAGYEQVVSNESDDAEYCVVSESVEGRQIHVHQIGGRWMARDEE